MATANMGHGEVKSICDKLECSPSQHDSSGDVGPKNSPHPSNRPSAAGGKQTSEFAADHKAQRRKGA